MAKLRRSSQKKKLRLIKAVDRGSRGTIAWVLGGCDSATFRRRYDKGKHLKHCRFHTDNWDAFLEVLPPERLVIGKSGTFAIEQNNSNMRHHLGRFTRRTQVVSKSRKKSEFDNPLAKPEVFAAWREKFAYIYKETLSTFLPLPE
jgi:IS1 family transposase